MKLNEYLLTSSWLILLTIIMVLFTGDIYWLFAIFMVGVSIYIRLNQEPLTSPELTIQREISGKRFQESSEIIVDLFITNNSTQIFLGEIVDELPKSASLMEGSNIFLTYLRPKQNIHIQYSFSFIRRGKYVIGPTHLRHHSGGELYDHIWIEEILTNIVIIPNPESVSNFTLPPSFFKSIGGPFRSKLIGEGADFTGIRQYHPGDPLKRINWKYTAKFRTLHSNEFEVYRPSNFIIILDLTEEMIEVGDASVRAALGLVDYLTHWRCRVGLLTLGEFIHFIPPKSGKRHLLDISEHLTNVKSITTIADIELFENRLRQVVHRASGIKNEVLLFSSLNHTENAILLTKILPKLGNLTILSPTGIPIPTRANPSMNFAKSLLELRKQVLVNYLNRNNIKIYDWVPDLPFEASINRWRIKS